MERWRDHAVDPSCSSQNVIPNTSICHGPLASYVKLRVAHVPGMPGTLFQSSQVSDPDMHHGTCVTHVPWCMPGLLTSGFLWSQWRGKRSRHSRRMRNPQFYVSGKRPMGWRAGQCQRGSRRSGIDRLVMLHIYRAVWSGYCEAIIHKGIHVHFTNFLGALYPANPMDCLQLLLRFIASLLTITNTA